MNAHKKFLVVLGFCAVLLAAFALLFLIPNKFISLNKSTLNYQVTRGYKLVKDKQNFFSVEIPESWLVETSSYSDFDNYLTGVTAKTQDFELVSQIENPQVVTPSTLTRGMQVAVTVTKGLAEQSFAETNEPITRGSVKITDVVTTYLIERDSSVLNAKIAKAQLGYGGYIYQFKLMFPEKDDKTAEGMFKHVVESFKIVNRQ